MQRAFAATALIILCCAACATVEKAPMDTRLLEAQKALDEGQRLKEAGKYAEVLPLVERALELREVALGGTHPEVASCLNLLGDVHRLLGSHARAEPLLQRALAIVEAAFGPHHPKVAQSLNNLAILYRNQGHYARAEPLLERALTIREATLGKSHPDVAASLHSLANLYYNQGHYALAEPLLERALAIREATLGKSHPELARSLHNLANLYVDQGKYARAEPLYERALAIWEAALGKNHPDVARSLRQLARLYHIQGDYARAEPLLERALMIQEVALGKNHSDVAHLLNFLANLYHAQGSHARAEMLYERSLATREAALGKNHPDVAHSLHDLASLYADQGDYARAEPLQERALAIWEAAFGKDHPDVARSLRQLANLYVDQGKYAWAEPLYERALVIQEAVLGGSHPEVSHSLHSLARLHFTQQHLSKAQPLIARAFAISEEHLRQEVFGLSEARLARTLSLLRADEERLYALVRAHSDDVRVRQLALSAALLRKGRSVEELAHTSRLIYRGLGQADREAFERLRSLRTQLSTLSLAGPGQRSPADYQQRLKELADQGDALEADLARRSAPLRALSSLPPPAEIVNRVAEALPSDGVLVEFVAYHDEPLVPRPGAPHAQSPGELRYLSLLLFPDGRTHARELGPAAPIDRAVQRLHDALASRAASYQPAAQALHALVFRPLVPHLGEARRLFLSPDGQLALVPFSALHDGRRFLVDALETIYLTSGRELLPRPQEVSPERSMVVLADPDFGAAPVSPSSTVEAAPARAERSASLEGFFSTLRAELADRPWPPLPGTRREAEAIQRLLPRARLLLGREATKEALLTLATPGVLHVASHGFFLEDVSAPPANTRAVGHFGAVGESGPRHRPPEPLLRSGLVLAGARAPEAQSGSLRREDSLVTALELAGLDLWGTQLVVLSACDTGRGDIKLGQGVYGLRRALLVAGTETLVTSLWKVNDETTRELMEDYYRHLLAGEGRAAALREAMKALRRKQPHPHFWAPFIAIGQDAPLRGLATRGRHENVALQQPRENLSVVDF
jgi:CHAT domain-containing protein/Tfp pilus assembly protein PilF